MSSSIPNIENTEGFWDRVGLWLSGICVIHCVLTLVFFAALPLGSTVFDFDTWTHFVLALLLVPTVAIGYRSSIKKGRPFYIRMLFLVGGSLVLVGLLAGELYSETAESILTILGSTGLVIGHWKNWRG